MEEGPASLCADENDAGERTNRIQEGGKEFYSEVLEQASEGASGSRPQPGVWTFMSTKRKENNICGDKKWVSK